MGDFPATTIPSRIAAPVSLPPDRSPYLVYLARLAPGSRPAMADALATIARIASGGRLGPGALPWHQLRYQHTQAIRQRLVETVSPRTGKPLEPRQCQQGPGGPPGRAPR